VAQTQWSQWSDYEWHRLLTDPAPPRSTATTWGPCTMTVLIPPGDVDMEYYQAYVVIVFLFQKDQAHDSTGAANDYGRHDCPVWHLSPLPPDAQTWAGRRPTLSRVQETRLNHYYCNPFGIDGFVFKAGLTVGAEQGPCLLVVAAFEGKKLVRFTIPAYKRAEMGIARQGNGGKGIGTGTKRTTEKKGTIGNNIISILEKKFQKT
jgi:hypothetical protein